jgi:hypothetical protein
MFRTTCLERVMCKKMHRFVVNAGCAELGQQRRAWTATPYARWSRYEVRAARRNRVCSMVVADVPSVRRPSMARVALGLLVAVVTTPGCFALFALDGFGPGATNADASTATPESQAPNPTCDPTAPFTKVEPLTELNTDGDENWINLSADELVALVVRAPAGTGPDGRDVFRTTRATRTSPFGPLQPITEINTAREEDNPTLTADGLALYFHRTPEGAPLSVANLWVARRATTTSPFDASPLSQFNTDLPENDPFVTPDERTLYFTSYRDAGHARLFRSRWTGSEFGPPTILSNLEVFDAGTSLIQAVPSSDGLVLYFAALMESGSDIFVATRATPADEFGSPIAVSGVNTDSPELPTWLSPDRCRLYFMSEREGGIGRDLYMASRSLP